MSEQKDLTENPVEEQAEHSTVETKSKKIRLGHRVCGQTYGVDSMICAHTSIGFVLGTIKAFSKPPVLNVATPISGITLTSCVRVAETRNPQDGSTGTVCVPMIGGLEDLHIPLSGINFVADISDDLRTLYNQVMTEIRAMKSGIIHADSTTQLPPPPGHPGSRGPKLV